MDRSARATLVAVLVVFACVIAGPGTALGAPHSVDNSTFAWRVPTLPGNQYAPVISGSNIAYQDYGPSGAADITALSLADNVQIPVVRTVANDADPAIWGDRVVWTAGGDIAYHDGGSGISETLTRAGTQGAADVWGDRIVFVDAANAGDIYLWNVATHDVTPICTNAFQQTSPTIFGDLIVWADYRNTNADLYMYDLSTGTEKRLTSDAANETSPDLWGTTVAFLTNKNGNQDVARAEHINQTDMESVVPDIIAAGGNQYAPSIWNERIVWASDDGDIWGVDPYFGGSGEVPTLLVSDSVTKSHPSISGDLVVYQYSDAVQGMKVWCAKLFFPKLPLTVPTGPVAYGGSATVYGSLTVGPGIVLPDASVNLRYQDEHGWWPTMLPFVLTSSEGRFAFTKTGLTRNLWVRAEYGSNSGDFLTGAGEPALIRVMASLAKPSGPKSVKHGVKFTTKGHIKPWHKAGTAWVTIKLYKKVGGHYQMVGSETAQLTDHSTYSQYSARFSLPSKGRWKIIATHSDSDHAWTGSAARYITVK